MFTETKKRLFTEENPVITSFPNVCNSDAKKLNTGLTGGLRIPAYS